MLLHVLMLTSSNHQNDDKRNVLWMGFVGETVSQFSPFSSFWTNRVLRDHRTPPTFLLSKKHQHAAERDYRAHPHTPPVLDYRQQLTSGQRVLRRIQLKRRFLPVNSVCTRSVEDDVTDERQDEDMWGIPAGREEVSGCVSLTNPCQQCVMGVMVQVLQVSHSLRLPKNYTASLLPSKAEYNEQRPQETSDAVTHSWTDPLRTETQPKPEGSSEAEHLARDKVHLGRRRTSKVLVLYP